jgi:deoxycytidylate deaminase
MNAHLDLSPVLDAELLSRDLDLFGKAGLAASLSDYSTRVGCVAAKSRKVIAVSANKLRNPSNNVPYGEASIHAEMGVMAMLLNEEYSKLTLYIARLGRLQNNLPSRPCRACILEITGCGIRELVYMDKFKHIVKEYL